MADYFLICSADSERQVRAIRDHVDDTLSRKGYHLFSTEGEKTFTWLLMDYSDLIVHIFKKDVRQYYSLERLWGDAPRLDLEADSGASSSSRKRNIRTAQNR